MSTGTYYGYATGAVATYARSGSGRLMSLTIGRIERKPPEGADWILRFTPRRQIDPKAGKALADRLSALSLCYGKGELEARRYQDAIDTAIVDFETRPAMSAGNVNPKSRLYKILEGNPSEKLDDANKGASATFERPTQ